MSVTSEWCTKKQAAKLIARTERTVSRIVRDAVEKQSADILSNLKLVYADGREVAGTDVTVNLLTKNEKDGSRTRWFFKQDWWRDVFVLRLNELANGEATTTDTIADQPETDRDRGVLPSEPPALPVDPLLRAIVFEHLHFHDQKHAAEIKQLMDRVLQVVETNQQLQGQTNTLYNQFQEALKQSGGLKALVEGTPKTKVQPTNHEPPTSQGTTTVVVAMPAKKRRVDAPPEKRPRKKQKPSAPTPPENNDRFPTFRGIARFFSRR